MPNLKTLIAVAATGLVLAGPVLLLSSCNTVEGVGKDVKSAGKTIEGAASGAKN